MTKAITLSVGDLNRPVVSAYSLGVIIHRLYLNKEYKGQEIGKIKKQYADSGDYRSKLDALLRDGILRRVQGLPPKAIFLLVGRNLDNVQEIACVADPFCYVSHLSAMEYHGLTDRMPVHLHLCSPIASLWRSLADQQMEKDLGEDKKDYLARHLPKLSPIPLDHIGRMRVRRRNSAHWGAYRNVEERGIRVSTIGRTFLDMLRDPDLCGGMRHVIDVYAKHAASYLQPIINEIDRHGSPIDKVRAGFILGDYLKMSHATIERWTIFVQRGGSRKLDATGEYIPVWSDKWCISLNVPGLSLNDPPH